jgi:hypothetical protein
MYELLDTGTGNIVGRFRDVESAIGELVAELDAGGPVEDLSVIFWRDHKLQVVLSGRELAAQARTPIIQRQEAATRERLVLEGFVIGRAPQAEEVREAVLERFVFYPSATRASSPAVASIVLSSVSASRPTRPSPLVASSSH